MESCAFVSPTPVQGALSATPRRLPDRTRVDHGARRLNTSSAIAPPSPSRPLRRSRSSLHLDWIAPSDDSASAIGKPLSSFAVQDVRDVPGPDGLTPAERWEAEMNKLRTNPRQAPDVEGIAAAGITRSLSFNNMPVISPPLSSSPTTVAASPRASANLTNAQKAYYDRINRGWGVSTDTTADQSSSASAASPTPAREYTQASSTFSVWSDASSSSSSLSDSQAAPVFSARMDRLSRVVTGETAPAQDFAPPPAVVAAVKPDVSLAQARWRRLAQHAGGVTDASSSPSATTATKPGKTSTKAPASSSNKRTAAARLTKAVANIVDSVTPSGPSTKSAPKASSKAASSRKTSSAPKATSAPKAASSPSQDPARSASSSSSLSHASTSSSTSVGSGSSAGAAKSAKAASSPTASAGSPVAKASSTGAVPQTPAEARVKSEKTTSASADVDTVKRDSPRGFTPAPAKAESKEALSSASTASLKKKEPKRKTKRKSKSKKQAPLSGPMAIGTSVDGHETAMDNGSMFSFTVLVIFTMLCLYLGERFSHLMNVVSNSGLF